jgi:hypothetical protein
MISPEKCAAQASLVDETAILTAMFASPLLPRPLSDIPDMVTDIQQPGAPLTREHCCDYDDEIILDDRAMLIDKGPKFQYAYAGYATDVTTNTSVVSMPTMWNCVKNAFTLSSL